MDFRLTYRGPLSSGTQGVTQEKHRLRSHFHWQLGNFYRHDPRGPAAEWIRDQERIGFGGQHSVMQEVQGHRYLPLACSRLCLVADLRVLFLRQAPPGAVRGHGGDLDNRLKNLLDALRSPHPGEVPEGTDFPTEGHVYTLLEDDCLVAGFTVETDRLLDVEEFSTDVALTVQVRLRATRRGFENMGF